MWPFKVRELRNDFVRGVVLGLIINLIAYYSDTSNIIMKNLNTLVFVCIIAIVLLAFMLVAIVVFPENQRIKFLKLHPTFRYVSSTFHLTILIFAILLLSALLLKTGFVRVDSVYFLIILIVLSLTLLYRCLWLFIKFIRLYYYKQ